MNDKTPICEHQVDDQHCGETEGLRHFNHGHRCPLHTPQALKGEPELPPGPGIPAYRDDYTPFGPSRPYPPASNFKKEASDDPTTS